MGDIRAESPVHSFQAIYYCKKQAAEHMINTYYDYIQYGPIELPLEQCLYVNGKFLWHDEHGLKSSSVT